MSHTKGKWRNGLHKRRSVVCDTEDGRPLTICVAEASNHIGQDEAVANAVLIAAAPDLLNACQWALAQFKRLSDEGNYPRFLLQENGGEGFATLTKAIRRATVIP